MKILPLILLLLAGCASNPGSQSVPPALPSTLDPRLSTPSATPAIIIPAPIPVLLPNPADNSDWLVVFPPGVDASKYTWSTLITTDLGQPMQAAGGREEWQGNSLILHTQGMANVFLKLQGTPIAP